MSELEENIKIPVSQEQKAAYDALPPDLKARLNTKALSAQDLRELGQMNNALAKHGERLSTVMCPW